MHTFLEQTAGSITTGGHTEQSGTGSAPYRATVVQQNSDQIWFDACQVVAETAAYARSCDDDRKVTIIVSVPDLPIMIAGDLLLLRRVLRSLVHASLCCAGQGSMFLSLGVHGDMMEFSIMGNGLRYGHRERCRCTLRSLSAVPLPTDHDLAAAHEEARLLGGSLSIDHGRDRRCSYTLTVPLGCQERQGWN